MTALPQTIGPYEILELLGEGGMGVVYRARHARSGEPAAVKTVRVPDGALLSSIRREIHALARVRHPGVVRVLDEGLDRGLPWYAMQLLEGISLRALAASAAAEEAFGGPKRAALVALARHLCAPLGYLHGEGIVHRDLKPENVAVLPSGAPVLFDFGLATRFARAISRDALDFVDEGAGTIAYMAPEQVTGDLVDARTDLYALGCILYEAVTGRPPFVAKRAVDVLRAHVETEPEPPSGLVDGVPADLDALVLRLLAKRPRDRIGYAGDVAAALAAFDGAAPIAEGAPSPRAYLYRPAFAGREEPLLRLRSLLVRLDRGAGGVAIVGGESGVGKTRFAVEVGRNAMALGLRVLAGECVPRVAGASGAPLLRPLARVVEAIADRCRQYGAAEREALLGDRAGLLASYFPELAGLAAETGSAEPAELPPAAARVRLYAYLAEALAALAARGRPLLLILDDLQWADELTLGFLEYMVRGGHFDRAPLALVGAFRSEEAGEGIASLLSSPPAVRVDLGRLDHASIAAIVGDMLALSPPPDVLSRYLARQSEGNPFFVAEYLRAAVDAGILWRDAAGLWQVSDRGPKDSQQDLLPLPGSLVELVGRRLDGLPAGALAAARACAVYGREVDAALLDPLLELGEAASMEAIGELVRRHVIVEAESGRLRFAHDKIREVAYASLSAAERSRLHRRAAEAIAPLAEGGRSDLLAPLGRHWEMAGEREPARRAYLAAARGARDRYAHGEAETLYRGAAALAGAGSAESVTVRLELAHDVLRLRGRAEEGVVEARAALAASRAVGDRAAEAECLRTLGILLWELSRMEEARDAFESALARSGGDRAFEGLALGNLANVHLQQGRLDEALACYERSLAAARETGDRRGEAVKLGNIAIVHYNRGRYAEARSLYERSIAISHEIGDRATEGRTLGNLALLLTDEGSLDEAGRLYERAVARAREVGDRREEGIILGNFCEQQMRAGRVEAALALGDQALAIHRETGNRRSAGIQLLVRASTEREVGRTGAAERSLDEAETLLAEAGDPLYLALCSCERGMLALARGRGARDELERARAIARELDAEPGSELMRSVAGLARAVAASEAGDPLA